MNIYYNYDKYINILLITSLYPGYLGQTNREVTFSIHNICREWIKYSNVYVIRPWDYFPKIFSFFKKAQYLRQYSNIGIFNIENVSVYRVPLIRFPRTKISNKQINIGVEKTKTYLEKINIHPDVVICHMIEPALKIGVIIKQIFNIPLILCLHNTDILELKKDKKILELIKYIDGIVFRSVKIKKEFFNIIRYNDSFIKKYYILYSGIQISKCIDKDLINKKINSNNTDFMIACNLNSKYKNVDLVIRSFMNIKNDKISLSIIGDGKLRKKLENISNVDKRIKFLGWKNNEEVLKFMEYHNAFILVSEQETFGLVYIEAMAKGCLTVGTKGEGIDGFIIDGKNGFLCNPNISDIESTIRKIISMNSFEKKRIIENALNTIENYSSERVAEQYFRYIYDIIINQKK